MFVGARATYATRFGTGATIAIVGEAAGHELDRARRIAATQGAEIRCVVEAAPSLVIVGSGRRRRLGKSFAEQLRDRLGRPVLVARNPGKQPYGRVVLAVDVDSDIGRMFDVARFVEPDAPISALHAFVDPIESILVLHGMGLADLRHHRRESAQEVRSRITAQLERAGLDAIDVRVEHGAPPSVLERVPSDDLLVVHRRSSWLERAAFGSVTRHVLEHGKSDVLLV